MLGLAEIIARSASLVPPLACALHYCAVGLRVLFTNAAHPLAAALARERRLLGDLRELLTQRGAPPEHLATLRQAQADLDHLFLLVVAGEFNAGKSALINALLGEPVLAEGVTPTTAAVTLLSYGER